MYITENSSYGQCHVIFNPTLSTPEDRTKASGDVVKSLGEKYIPGMRNEVLVATTCSSFNSQQTQRNRMYYHSVVLHNMRFFFLHYKLGLFYYSCILLHLHSEHLIFSHWNAQLHLHHTLE